MKEYVLADTHFGHANIIKYCNRPFKDVQEMDEALITNWNKVIKGDDKVYLLGDFIFGNRDYVRYILSRLNGYKVLVMGNHDFRVSKSVKFWMDAGFNEVSKQPIIIYDNIILQHQPMELMHTNEDFYYIYGHVHNSEFTGGKTSACVSAELLDYTPKRLSEVINEIDKRNKRP